MRHVCSNSAYLIARVATLSSRFGYCFYVLGRIPEGKDPCSVDKKLIQKYGVMQSRVQAMREFRKGKAKIKYLRWGRVFVLLATEGESPFFQEERPLDIRVTPLAVGNYTVQVKEGRAVVMWSRRSYKRLRRKLLRMALLPKQVVEERLLAVRHLRYGGVTGQKGRIVRAINQKRRVAGLGRIVIPRLPA